MAEDIKIAIIGHGFMGHEHEKMLSNFPGIKLVGFADRDPSQLEDVGEGLKRYKSNEELFADPDVDTVLIAANNNQHHDLVIQAAKAHKHVDRLRITYGKNRLRICAFVLTIQAAGFQPPAVLFKKAETD